MVELINGRGQLGEAFKSLLQERLSNYPAHSIYHTWNVFNKTEHVQKAEFEKFV